MPHEKYERVRKKLREKAPKKRAKKTVKRLKQRREKRERQIQDTDSMFGGGGGGGGEPALFGGEGMGSGRDDSPIIDDGEPNSDPMSFSIGSGGDTEDVDLGLGARGSGGIDYGMDPQADEDDGDFQFF